MSTPVHARWKAAAAVLAAFAAVAALLLWMMPRPHSERDYLIAGTCGTLVALVVLFVVLGGMGALRPRRR